MWDCRRKIKFVTVLVILIMEKVHHEDVVDRAVAEKAISK
jgi:hypothetical protein